MRKNGIYLLVLILAFASGCTLTPTLKTCMDRCPLNWTTENVCYAAACAQFGWQYGGSSQIDEALVMCSPTGTWTGAVVEVDFWNAYLPECEETVQNRLCINQCMDSR